MFKAVYEYFHLLGAGDDHHHHTLLIIFQTHQSVQAEANMWCYMDPCAI